MLQRFIGRSVDELKVTSEKELILDLHAHPTGLRQACNIFRNGIASTTLGDFHGDIGCTSAQRTTQAKSLGLWEAFCDAIGVEGEGMRLMPNIEVMKISQGSSGVRASNYQFCTG